MYPRKYFPLVVLLLALGACEVAEEQEVPPVSGDPLDDAAVSQASESKYQAESMIEREFGNLQRWGGGIVVVGQVEIPDGTPVASRTTLLADGSFATALYPGRRVAFYAHGYDPLVIDTRNEVKPHVHDVGTHRFIRTESNETRTLSGTISGPVEGTVRLQLSLRNEAYLGRDHGHWGGRPVVPVERKGAVSGETFAFEGLSAVPYLLKVSAPGFVSQDFEVDPVDRGRIDLGEIRMTPARRVAFEYVSQFDVKNLTAQTDVYSAEVVADGENRFVYTGERDSLGNEFFLTLEPGDTGVAVRHRWHPYEPYDLGPASLEPLLDPVTLTRKLNSLEPSRALTLRDGHVYFFCNEDRGTNCLFRVTASTPAYD